MSRKPLAAAIALLGLAGCKSEVVDTVELAFVTTDAGLVSGFTCDGPADAGCRFGHCLLPDESLADKVLPSMGGSGKVSLVIDFIGTQGSPRSDPSSLLHWCDSHDCSPLPGTRVCIEHSVTAQGSATLAVSQAILGLADAGALLTSNAPADPVVVRVIATAQGCDAGLSGTGQPDCSQLVGCAYSSPVVLSTMSGPLELELDLGLGALGSTAIANAVCGPAVATCARTPLNDSTICSL